MAQPPFESRHELNKEWDVLNSAPGSKRLPGHPRLEQNDAAVCQFLRQEFDLGDLAILAPRLWIMSTQDSSNISALHRQKVKGREIVITEEARLHGVWYYNRIFLKPLPQYLLSYQFWETYLLPRTSPLGIERELIYRVALGYLRTYFYLIRHESDYRIATDEELQLVPKGITWEQFCDFSKTFDRIADNEVCERYKYGEIRLSRLNFYIKLFLKKQHFHRINSQYGAYFARIFGPILVVFGILSVLLSAMQLEMAVEQLYADHQWTVFWLVCRWFSIICLIAIAALLLCLFSLWTFMFYKEWTFALKAQWRSKKL